MIPEIIKQKIINYYSWSDNEYDLIAAAEYGFSLAESEIEKWRNGYNTIFDQSKNKIEEQDFEIERLKEQNIRLRKYLSEYDKDYAKKHGIV